MTLNPHHLSALESASTIPIEAAASRLITNLNSGSWLATINPYLKHSRSKAIGDHISSGKLQETALLEYLASSGPLHCLDGWAYLGRAIDAHIHANVNASIHFAYYAELRAAIALLAMHGIGVFNYKHLIFDSGGRWKEIKGETAPRKKGRKGRPLTTHVFVWEALQVWSDSSAGGNLLGEMVSVAGSDLNEWLREFHSGYSSSLVARQLLETWGLDLMRVAHDRSDRNTASYEPGGISTVEIGNLHAASDVLSRIWQELEPSHNNAFAVLDGLLIKHVLRNVYELMDPQPSFGERIAATIDNLGIKGAPAQLLREFFLSDETSFIISQALLKSAFGVAGQHVQVMARAVLLLRIATGAVAHVYKRAGIGRSDLEFWWRRVIDDAGFWQPGSVLDEFDEMWADVSAAIEGLREWLDNNPSLNSRRDWHIGNSFDLMTLSGCERIGLWGLGL